MRRGKALACYEGCLVIGSIHDAYDLEYADDEAFSFRWAGGIDEKLRSIDFHLHELM